MTVYKSIEWNRLRLQLMRPCADLLLDLPRKCSDALSAARRGCLRRRRGTDCDHRLKSRRPRVCPGTWRSRHHLLPLRSSSHRCLSPLARSPGSTTVYHYDRSFCCCCSYLPFSDCSESIELIALRAFFKFKLLQAGIILVILSQMFSVQQAT